MITTGDASFYGINFEVKTLDYINNIDDVERFAKDLRIDRKIVQKYNKKRDKGYVNQRNVEFEHFSNRYQSI